jgi:hypothetical protein
VANYRDDADSLFTEKVVNRMRLTRTFVSLFAYLLIASTAYTVWVSAKAPSPSTSPQHDERDPLEEFDSRESTREQEVGSIPPGIVVYFVLGLVVFGFLVPLYALCSYSGWLNATVKRRTQMSWQDAVRSQRFLWIVATLLTWVAVVMMGLGVIAFLSEGRSNG